MNIKFEEQNDTNSNYKKEITLSTCDGDKLVIDTIQTVKNEAGFHGTQYVMDKKQLSDYIGVLLHIQAKLKRGV